MQFASYLNKVFKQVHPDLGLGKKAMVTFHALIMDAMSKVAREAANMAAHKKSETLTALDVQSAVRLVFPGELALHAVSDVAKAVAQYTTDADNE